VKHADVLIEQAWFPDLFVHTACGIHSDWPQYLLHTTKLCGIATWMFACVHVVLIRHESAARVESTLNVHHR
jgi:hypothetical protein